MTFLRQLRAVLVKDFVVELRTKDAFSAMAVFALLVLVVFNFALDLSRAESLRVAPGVLWISIAFAGVLGFNRSFALEMENGSLQSLVATPIGRSALYLGKFLANCIFMFAVELFLVPVFIVLFDIRLEARLGLLVLVMILGTTGFSAAGTMFAAIAANTRMREVLLPVLLLPISVPVIIGAVEATGSLLIATEGTGISGGFKVLLAFNVAYITASMLIFEYVLED